MHEAPDGRRWGWVLALNLPLLISVTFGTSLPAIPTALLVGLVLFLVPGLAWVDLREPDGFIVVFRAMVISVLASVLAIAVVIPWPGPTDRIAVLVLLIAITNLGIYRGLSQGRFSGFPWTGPFWRWMSVLAVAFFLQSFHGASGRVPALEDQDMETQGTAYGLMNEFKPTMVTNRGTTFFFAHPLLLHFWIGESALLSGDLERLAYYHESALAVNGSGWDDMMARWEADFAQFEQDPVLLPTRTPNLFLSALILFPLGLIILRLSGSLPAALGGALLYMTLPEVYARSAYGGYMAVTNFMTVGAAYFFLQRQRLIGTSWPSGPRSAPPSPEDPVDPGPAGSRAPLFTAAALSAWTNQKALVVPVAAAAHSALISVLDGRAAGFVRDSVRRPLALPAGLMVIGFGVGWLGYIAYGLAIGSSDFISDHIVRHVMARFQFQDLHLVGVRGLEWEYPSMLGLWGQFSSHTGWVVAAAGAAALGWSLTRVRDAEGMLATWIGLVAVGFTLTDWRQTKHLALLLPPLVILVAVWWAASRGWPRKLIGGALVGAVAWNVWRVALLMEDFTYIQPTPIW